MNRIRAHHVLLLPALLAIACAAPPAAEQAGAERAVESARTTGAETYAAPSFHRTELTLAQAKSEIKTQDDRFAFLRSYTHARQLLLQVKADAAHVQDEAETARSQAQQNARTAIDGAKNTLNSAFDSLARAPHAKDSRTDVAAMQADLEALRNLAAQAEVAYGTQSYALALQRAAQVREQASSIAADIASARTKAHRT
jgi:hypothetical protein